MNVKCEVENYNYKIINDNVAWYVRFLTKGLQIILL